ncbi:hypothetical protein [Cupriavidus nantongensis]|uniref:hypothetical protein n=1 Tax=Cupriavidus nantongensis TaxID=1796606 RepID=UPI0022486E11
MSIVDVATLLGRSPDGVRVALYTDTDFSRKLKPAMLRVGRRVYFRTLQITEALNLEQPTDDDAATTEASMRGPRA